MESSTAAVTLNVLVPVVLPNVALIRVLPWVLVVASPRLLTVDVVGVPELHATASVRLWCVLSL